MGDPRNPARKNEIYDPDRLARQFVEIRAIQNLNFILSGGLAWHFLSPSHTEYKILHDHKDVDIFVPPPETQAFRAALRSQGFECSRTQWDRNDFFRLVKFYDRGKIVFDIFVQAVPSIPAHGYRVVDPKVLLGFYKTMHQSGDCVAVMAARKLLAAGKSVLNSPELIRMP